MIKHILQGRPLGHPLHVMLVHLPIGLFALSLFFDLLSLARSDAFIQPAFYTMALGVLTALVAAVPGFADYSDIRRDAPARRIATRHMLLNLAAVVLYGVNATIRWRTMPDVGILPFLLSLVGIAILSYSGYLGGTLVYGEGVGVGRHRRRGKMPRETVKRTAVGDQFVEIADAAELDDGESLRAEINGVVIAVAQAGGRVYAFQEFCMHRHGPLSEGSFTDDGKVICPWHRSCFDMSSGAVVDGPAKEPIPIYDAEVRDGKVMVRVQSHRPTQPSP